MRISLTTLVLLLLWSVAAIAMTGTVVDQNNQPIEGVSVVTDVSGVGAKTDRKGDFEITGLDEVSRLTFSAVGYRARQFAIENVPQTIVLERMYIKGENIVVTADRARPGQSAVTHDNISRQEIERDYTVGEFPLILSTTPNLYSWSDGGSALGYSYMSIRGFDDKRVSTYINGVPLNDPEDQATYFVDLPDFASNVTDIQIQRGVGNSLYGDASFGGSVNIVTNAFGRERGASVTVGYGEYTSGGKSVSDIYRQSMDFSSGLIDGRWHYSGRFSKQKSGGYRHHSWYQGWAYYLSAARLDPNMWTELHIYGGPIKMHLTYYGSPRSVLEKDHRANPMTYSNETDNFNQPHYQLHNVYKLNEKATLSNTLYYIRGKGFYEQYRDGAFFADYNFTPEQVGDNSSGDLVRQQHVNKSQYGWNPRLDIVHDKGQHSIGGSFYYFESEHWGQVTWAQSLSDGLYDGLDPQHRYYEWFGTKYQASFFLQELYDLNERWNLQATAQARYISYSFDQTKMGAFAGYQYDLDWFFLSPRVGVTYKANENLSVYGFAAISSRTPTDASIYDASDPYAVPSLEVESVSRSGSDSTVTFGDPTADSERVLNFELGASYQKPTYTFGANLFWMDFSNEIIKEGRINPSTGLAYTVNADRSVHAGIELTGGGKIVDGLNVEGNFAWNYNRVKEHVGEITVYEGTFSRLQDIDYADKTINGFPEYLGNLAIIREMGPLQSTLKFNFVGKQYVELYNVDSLAIDAYMVASWSTSYTFKNLLGLGDATLKVSIENLFDEVYESAGYGWSFGTAPETNQDPAGVTLHHGGEYYPAAERWFWTQVTWSLL